MQVTSSGKYGTHFIAFDLRDAICLYLFIYFSPGTKSSAYPQTS